MPKYWVKNYFTRWSFPEVGQKQSFAKYDDPDVQGVIEGECERVDFDDTGQQQLKVDLVQPFDMKENFSETLKLEQNDWKENPVKNYLLKISDPDKKVEENKKIVDISVLPEKDDQSRLQKLPRNVKAGQQRGLRSSIALDPLLESHGQRGGDKSRLCEKLKDKISSINNKKKTTFIDSYFCTSQKEERKEKLSPRKLSRGEIKGEIELELQDIVGNRVSLVVADIGKEMAAQTNLKTKTTSQTGQQD